MNPTELYSLFSAKEPTLLVATEAARLKDLSEDEVDELPTMVRRRWQGPWASRRSSQGQSTSA